MAKIKKQITVVGLEWISPKEQVLLFSDKSTKTTARVEKVASMYKKGDVCFVVDGVQYPDRVPQDQKIKWNIQNRKHAASVAAARQKELNEANSIKTASTKIEDDTMETFKKNPATKKKAVKAAAKTPAEKKVPEPGYSVGLKSKIGVTATWNKYFMANFKSRLTDDQLTDAMLAEFPKRETVQPVPRVRSWFNSGKYGFGVLGIEGANPDDKRDGDEKSIAYGEDKKPIRKSEEEKAAEKEKEKKAKVAEKKAEKKASKPPLKFSAKGKIQPAAKKKAVAKKAKASADPTEVLGEDAPEEDMEEDME